MGKKGGEEEEGKGNKEHVGWISGRIVEGMQQTIFDQNDDIYPFWTNPLQKYAGILWLSHAKCDITIQFDFSGFTSL